jgi:hypothetical protein
VLIIEWLIALGSNTQMIKLRRIQFGVIIHYVNEFVFLAEQISDVWQADDILVIKHIIEQIKNFIPNFFYRKYIK